jgi:hypothetical protein
MKNNEFINLAKKIVKNLDGHDLFICNDLCINSKNDNKLNFFKDYFKPNKKELKKYKHHVYMWMQEIACVNDTGGFNKKLLAKCNNHRILALLFANELWEEVKQDYK